MHVEQLPFLLALNSIYKLRPADIFRLLTYYQEDAMETWHHYREWAHLLRLPSGIDEELRAMHNSIEPDKLMSDYLASGCSIVSWLDNDYPASLRNIYDPPMVLFYYGHLPSLDELCLAVIGSRRSTPYGRQVAELFSRDLAAQGVVIISGMARGIDSVAHRAALAAGGRTVAVLGSGLDVIYPRENAGLYAQICEHGAVISEFPLGTAALAMNFPRRNRIISGLSRGIIVVEAGEKSGTLGTVRCAAEQNRDVFAIPGNITSPNSRGVNRMIRDDGVLIALAPEDVWREYSTAPMQKASLNVHRTAAAQSDKGPSPIEKRLLQLLLEPQQADALAADSDLGLDAAALASTLMMMELRGLIRKLPGNYYQTIIKHIQA